MPKENGVSIKMKIKEKKKSKKWEKFKKIFSKICKILLSLYNLALYAAFLFLIWFDAYVLAAGVLLIIIHVEIMASASTVDQVVKNQKVLNAGIHVLATNQQFLLDKVNENSCTCSDKKTVKKAVKKVAKKTTKKKAVKKK